MKNKSKLRMNKMLYFGIALVANGIIYVFAQELERKFWGTHYSGKIFSINYVLIGLLFAYSLRKISKVLSVLLAGFILAFGLSTWHRDLVDQVSYLTMTTYFINLGIAFLFVLIYGIYGILIKRKKSTLQRNLFELVAKPIADVTNGFTTRPYPAGSFDYKKDEIIEFAKFLRKKMIANYEINEDRVIIIISAYTNYLLSGKSLNASTVIFKYNGEVSVNISQRDYKEYRNELSFEQVCKSFSDIFIGFLNNFKQKKYDKIIKSIRSVDPEAKTNLITGLLIFTVLLLIITFVIYAYLTTK